MPFGLQLLQLAKDQRQLVVNDEPLVLKEFVKGLNAAARWDSMALYDTVGKSSETDRSVTITLGGTAQTAAAANPARRYLFIQNPSGSGGTLWFSTKTTAVAASPSIELVAGASYESPAHYCPTGALSVIHGTTNAKITIREA